MTRKRYSPEHKVIAAKNIFYKSEYEKDIYIHFSLNKRCNLIRGGLVASNPFYSYDDEHFKNNILIIDTAINQDSLRSQSIKKFYQDIIEKINVLNNLTFTLKIHPGQSQEMINFMEDRLVNDKITIAKDIDTYLLKNTKMVFSFYSTMLQELILAKFPIILVSDYYETKPFGILGNEFDKYESIISIRVRSDINALLRRLERGFDFCKYGSILHQEFTKMNNFPAGLNEIRREIFS